MGRLPVGLGDGVVSGHDCCSLSISIYCLILKICVRGSSIDSCSTRSNKL
jgi:hypothetical protein